MSECGEGRCLNGGTCAQIETEAECTCSQGFTGVYCEEDIDECAENICKNGGTCSNTYGSYECTCPPNFSGFNCEVGKVNLAIS